MNEPEFYSEKDHPEEKNSLDNLAKQDFMDREKLNEELIDAIMEMTRNKNINDNSETSNG